MTASATRPDRIEGEKTHESPNENVMKTLVKISGKFLFYVSFFKKQSKGRRIIRKVKIYPICVRKMSNNTGFSQESPINPDDCIKWMCQIYTGFVTVARLTCEFSLTSKGFFSFPHDDNFLLFPPPLPPPPLPPPPLPPPPPPPPCLKGKVSPLAVGGKIRWR